MSIINNVKASQYQPDSRLIGYEWIDDETLHFWNNATLDGTDYGNDYYINYTSFLQITNHNNKYWSHNVFCGKYRTASIDWTEKCFDKVSLNRTIETDNLTFINITGVHETTISEVLARFQLVYALRVNDSDLAIFGTVNITNSPPIETAVTWKINDIKINSTQEDDAIAVNKTLNYLNNTINITYNNLGLARVVLQDIPTNEFLRFSWRNTTNTSFNVQSEPGQYNAVTRLTFWIPVTSGSFSRTTNITWLDGTTTCGDGASGVASITMSSPPTSPQNTETSFTVGCTVLTDTGLGACSDYIQHQRATGPAYQDVPTNYTPVTNARSQGKTLDNSGAGINGIEDVFTIDGCGLRHSTTNRDLVLSCQASLLRDNGNVTCNDILTVSYPFAINLNQKNFTNINNNTMIIDCNAQDNTNINDIQIYTNISATGNETILNQTLNLFGTGTSLVYNTTKTYTINNVPNGSYKYSCLVNDTANNRFMSQNYTYTISFNPIQYNLTYDANGNLINGFDKYYEYDSFNRLIRVRNSTNNTIAEYFYDDDVRIKKIDVQFPINQTTYYIGDFVQVRNSSGVFNSTYYYDKDGLVGEDRYDGNIYYYHQDHLGSTSVITNQSGNKVEETNYDPYGEVTEGGNSRYLYTGKELDKETNFEYYGARYYYPGGPFFVMPDSVIQDVYNPQSLNRYSYVLNNPYKYVDPSGNIAIIPLAIAYIVVETAIDVVGLTIDIIDYKMEPSTINKVAVALDVTDIVLVGGSSFLPTPLGTTYKWVNRARHATEAGSNLVEESNPEKDKNSNLKKETNSNSKENTNNIYKSPPNQQPTQAPYRQTPQNNNLLSSGGYGSALFSYDVRRPDDTWITRNYVVGGGYVDTPINNQDKKNKNS